MNKISQNDQPQDAPSLIHWSAVSAGSVVGGGVAAAASLIWVAAAFSSHESWAYGHMAPWIGASVVAGSLAGGVVTGVLSNRRGTVAGTASGLTTGAVIAVAGGVLALLALAVNGSFDQSLVWGGHAVTVDFLRPYTAFWAMVGTLALASVGGAIGGLIPRAASKPVIELAALTELTQARPGRVTAEQASGF